MAAEKANGIQLKAKHDTKAHNIHVIRNRDYSILSSVDRENSELNRKKHTCHTHTHDSTHNRFYLNGKASTQKSTKAKQHERKTKNKKE